MQTSACRAVLASRIQDGAIGTPQFMPPEQALGEVERFDASTDVYAVGSVLYACLCGRPPLVSGDSNDLIAKIVSQRPIGLRQQGIAVPCPFEAIILKCLEKDQPKRYSSISELQQDILSFRAGEPISAKPPNLLDQVQYNARKHLFAASVSGFSVFLLLILVGWLVASFISQSMELQDLQDRYAVLRKNVNTRLHPSVKAELEDAVAQEHFEVGRLDVAAEVAAEALLAQAEAGGKATGNQLKILEQYAQVHSLEWDPRNSRAFAISLLNKKTDDAAGNTEQIDKTKSQEQI